MHESRIAALERRLVVLDEKEAAGGAREVIDLDRFETGVELARLIGIRDRNIALDEQRPVIAEAADAALERKRSLRERIQFTPGQGPKSKSTVKAKGA